MNGDRTARQCIAKASLLDLPHSVPHTNGVVLSDDRFRLHREDPVQIQPARTAEGTCLLFCRDREFALEYVYVRLAQESIGLFQRAACRQPKRIICTPDAFIALPTCV